MNAINKTALSAISLTAGLLLAASVASAQTAIPDGRGPAHQPRVVTPAPVPSPEIMVMVTPHLPPATATYNRDGMV